jgi:hypothetical protein
MGLNPIFKGLIKQNKLILDFPAKFTAYLSGLENSKVEVIVRKQKSQRSLNQNAAYWGIVVEMLCEHTGIPIDERETMHEALKIKFASHVDPVSGLTIVESTAGMSTVRFMRFYEDIQRWAAEFHGLDIPSPNEPDWGTMTYGDVKRV